MRLSTIAKHSLAGARSPFALSIGAEIRRLRVARGMSQSELGRPLTRSFVSSVEAGNAMPSLPALILLTARLGVSLEAFFGEVNRTLTGMYTAPHDHDQASPDRRRRFRLSPSRSATGSASSGIAPD